MPRWRRTTRIWLALGGTVWVPLVITVSGLTGFWPVLGVCAAGVIWTCYLFRSEIASITVDVPPNERNQGPFWLILPGLAMLLVALYPFVRLFETQQVTPLNFEDLLQPYIHDRSLYISDLARTTTGIEGKTFEHVTFVGPAVVAIFDGVDMTSNDIDARPAPPESAFVVVPSQTKTLGIIPIRDSTFRHCLFQRIQFVGTEEEIARLKAGVTRINGQPIAPGGLR
jgi:hypothetical protein